MEQFVYPIKYFLMYVLYRVLPILNQFDVGFLQYVQCIMAILNESKTNSGRKGKLCDVNSKY